MKPYDVCVCGKPYVSLEGGAFFKCPDAPVGTEEKMAYFYPSDAAWVCGMAKRKIKEAIATGRTPPPVNPEAIRATKERRARLDSWQYRQALKGRAA